jgi:arylsulfatase A-like enzyme/Tfp pilus assembly protein PilF
MIARGFRRLARGKIAVAMRRAALTSLLASALAWSCRSAPPPSQFPDAPVVLVSIDTLRADHLPLYGYAVGTTPNLDRLGREGIVFEDVYSHCPLTLPAHASMLTGLLPPHHGVRDNIGFQLAPDHATLATRFRGAGFHTGGAVSAYVLRQATGIGQGFDFYDDAIEVEGGTESIGNLQRDGAITVEALSHWIGGQGGARFFAFLHLYEPHSPYTPPPRHQGHALAYDGEIAYADELVGRLLDALQKSGLYDRAIIAVTSDHGEGLGDHGEAEHGIFLYREEVHVPLIVRLPHGLRGGTRVPGTVAQSDLAPTLLDLAGVPGTGFDGVSLRETMAAPATAGHSVYSETFYPRYHLGWSELFAASDGRYRYVRAPRPELFDLASDGREQKNLAPERASVAAAMERWLEERGAGASASAPEEVPSDVREKLQALGYVGSSAAHPTAGAALPDPKDHIGAYEDFKRALSLRLAGRRAEAVDQLRKVVGANPDMRDAWEMLGATLVELDRKPEAVAALDRTIALDPTGAEAHLALARIFTLDGRRELALQHAEVAARRDPGKAYELMAQIDLDLDRPQPAAEMAQRSLKADPSRVMSHFVLGVVAQRGGRFEEALGSFRRADEGNHLQKDSVVLGLHARMADCLARLGREAEAEREFQAEIAAVPWSREGRVGLAMLYRAQGRDADSRAALEGLVGSTPQAGADVYWTVVKTFADLGDTAAARDWAARARARFPRDPRFRP